ncbi:MAG: MarR family transcriptional regulator [Candidatus Micrarchaeota archaeon]|nr:MarR family transcriptional regulator [Candidatus Micrarchaeota archaeon]
MNLEELPKSALKILAFLARHPSGQKYAREISREAGVSAGAASQELRKLAEAGLVSRQRRGKEFFYSLRTADPVVRQAKILFTLLELRPLVEKLAAASEKIVLFGSCSEGTDVEESDVDLLVITEKRQAVWEAVRGFKSAKKIAPVAVSLREWIEMKRKDRPFYERVEKGIILASKLGSD